MGCDIHTVLERRVGDKWITVDTLLGMYAPSLRSEVFQWAQPYIEQRNYELFADMAGVRGDGPEPRGLPDDLSETAAYLAKQWEGDGHSHSWLPIQEVTVLLSKYNQDGFGKRHEVAGYYFNIATEPGETYEEAVDAHRLVFWFDN